MAERMFQIARPDRMVIEQRGETFHITESGILVVTDRNGDAVCSFASGEWSMILQNVDPKSLSLNMNSEPAVNIAS